MNWRTRRQLAILIVVLTFFGAIFGLWYWLNKPTPTCFDNIKNGTEIGVDCGGGCLRVCTEEVRDIRNIWARVFEITPGVYSVVGLFENPNLGFASTEAKYTISYVSRKGEVLGTEEGITFINPAQTFPIFASNFQAEAGEINQVFITFTDINWQRYAKEQALVSLVRQNLTLDPTPRLEASVTNNSAYDLRDFQVVAVLSDASGNAFTTSATLVDSLSSGQSKNIFFTWRLPFEKEVAIIDLYPRVSTFDTP